MKNAFVLFPAAALILFSGCLLRGGRATSHSSHAVRSGKEGACHPSQYWDGSKCRHKGKGHGARKHDD